MAGELEARAVLEKAYEKLLPAAGYLISNTAGFMASVVVFTTWLLRKAKSAREKTRLALERDEARLIALKQEIEKAEEKLERLRRLAAGEKSEWRRRRLERSIEDLEKRLDNLMMEYELVELRIMAVRKLRQMGAEGVLKDAYKLAEKIEEGKIEDVQYKVLKELENEWKKKVITIDVLKRIVEKA